MDGTIIESQKILTDDPMLQGFYRTRRFDSPEAYHGKARPPWQHVLFRTMSENPLSASQWNHPGIQPAHILRAVDRWLNQNLSNLLDSFIDAEINAINERMK
jgi:hypothetical protein